MMNNAEKKLLNVTSSDTQAIRFLKTSKLEFNFLEKVRAKVRESDTES